MKIKLSIKTKILAIFLGLSILSLGIFSAISLQNINMLGRRAMDSNISLGENAIKKSIRHMELLGEKIIKREALDIARQLEIYIKLHPDTTVKDLQRDKTFSDLAVQPVGETGYTAVTDVNSLICRFHSNPKIVNMDLRNLAGKLAGFWTIMSRSKGGVDSSGYYDWKEADGSIKQKYMYIAIVNAKTKDGVIFSIAATTYIDEFSRPVKETKIEIEAAIMSTTQQINNTIRRTKISFVIISIILMVIVSGIIWLFAKMITNPITVLTKNAEAVGKGNLESRAEVRTGDELEDLANTFNKMTEDLKAYIKDLNDITIAKGRMEGELKIAQEIQSSMLPQIFPPFPERKEFEIFAIMEPAREVGGDFYDFFFINERKLCFIIGDVSGKGIPAALFMVITKILIKNEALQGSPPDKILSRINNKIFSEHSPMMFVSIICAIMDTKTGEVEYANAGHNFPLLFTGGKSFEYLESDIDTVLGPIENIEYKSHKMQLYPGNILFLYTDGITEAMNPENKLFSDERLQKTIYTFKDSNVNNLVNGIRIGIKEFILDAEQSDDITMLAIKYNG